MVSQGVNETVNLKKSKRTGRPSRSVKNMINVSIHLQKKGQTKRRCVRCALYKKEKRTKSKCKTRDAPL